MADATPLRHLAHVVQVFTADTSDDLDSPHADAHHVTVEVQGGDARYAIDSTNPTASIGAIAYEDDVVERMHPQWDWREWLMAVKFINKDAGVNITLVIDYYE